VDSWLVDDEELIELEDQKNVIRSKYCENCGSTNISSCEIISHSLSQSDTNFFMSFLPSLDDLIFVDVGSRLGSILYSVYYNTSAKKIYGIEFCKYFAMLQKDMISKFNMDDRITIIQDDVRNCESILLEANVVFLNNVFEFFIPKEEMKDLWITLKYIFQKKPSLYIFSCPPSANVFLRSSIFSADDIDEWLITVRHIGLEEDTNSAALYMVR
jgi:hypothetical protein